MSKSRAKGKKMLLPSEALSMDYSERKFLTKETGNNNSKIRQFNGFKIDNINLVIDANVGCQVSLNSQVYPMPNMNQSMIGVCSFKGSIVPVFSLHEYLFESSKRNQKIINNNKYLLTFGDEKSYLGIYSDVLPIRVDFSVSQITLENIDINEKLRRSLSNVFVADDGDIWFELESLNIFANLAAA